MSLSRGPRLLAILALVICLPLAACGGDDSAGSTAGDENEPFELVFVGGTTGPFASNTAQLLNGTRAAIKKIEEDGGLGGRKIKLTVLNDEGDPTTAVSVLRGYLSKGNTPDAVYAGVTSTVTLAILPLLTREKIFSYAQTNNPQLDDPEKYPYHFGALPTSTGQLAGIGEELEKAGAKKLGLLVPNDAFGKGTAATVEEIAKAAGIATNTRMYDPSAVDLTVPYEAALAGKPDAVFLEGADVQQARVLAAREKVGATDIPTFGGSGFSTTPPSEVASEAALRNLRFVTEAGMTFVPEEERSQSLQFFLEEGGFLASEPKYASAWVSAIGYDALRWVSFVAEQADGTDGDAMKEAAEALKTTPEHELITQPERSFSAESHFTDTPFAWIPGSASLENGMWKTEGGQD